MTRAARKVLSDCYVALQLLNEEEDPCRWRIHWAGAVALIRAVGHVLDKVDGRQTPAIKKAAKIAYLSWKGEDEEHRIFRDFIELERNNILKKYESNVHPLDEVPVALFATAMNPETGEFFQIPMIDLFEKNIFRPIVEGYGEGDDARDIYQDAIDWWERELDAIDGAAARA